MSLSDTQIAMLNALMYENEGKGGLFAAGDEGRTLGAVLDKMKRSEGYSPSCEEIVDAVLEDDQLSALVVADVDSYNDLGSRAVCFQEPGENGVITSTSDLYVVFKGTGTDEGSLESEWYTNALGLTESDTDPQIAAASYIEYLDRKYGGDIIASGHSNGANKAMYAAITTSAVDRCVVFDGQGFSPAFIDKYADEVAERSGSIAYYGLTSDYVGPLLLPVADKTYIRHGDIVDWNALSTFANNHAMTSFFTEMDDGSYGLVEGHQSQMSMQIEQLVRYLYDEASHKELTAMAPAVGKLLNALLGSKEPSFSEVVFDPANAEGLAYFLFYLLTYEGGDELVSYLLGEFQAAGVISVPVLGDLARRTGVNIGDLYSLIAMSGTSSLIGDLLKDYIKGRLRTVGQLAFNPYHATGNVDAVRDFTDAKREELLSVVRQVNAEPWFDPTKWDVWYRAERWYGRLTIDSYQSNMKEYYRKVIDIEGVSEGQINQIFDQAAAEAGRFASDVRLSFAESVGRVCATLSLT